MHSIRFYALKVYCIHISTSKQMNFKMNVLIKQKKSYLQARKLLMKFYFSNNKPAFCLSWACMCIPSEQLHRAASSLPPTRGQWIVLRLEHGGHTYTASGDAMVTLLETWWRGWGQRGDRGGIFLVRMRPGPSRGQWRWGWWGRSVSWSVWRCV